MRAHESLILRDVSLVLQDVALVLRDVSLVLQDVSLVLQDVYLRGVPLVLQVDYGTADGDKSMNGEKSTGFSVRIWEFDPPYGNL